MFIFFIQILFCIYMMTMSGDGHKELKKFRQRFYRIYEPSPDLGKKDLLRLFIKATKQRRLAELIVEFIGKYDVNTIAQKLRRKKVAMSAMDVFDILEKLRKDGYLRVVGTGLPKEEIKRIEAKRVTKKVVEAPPHIVEAPPAIEAPPVEIPGIEALEVIPTPLEVESPEVQLVPIQQYVQFRPSLPEHLSRFVEGVQSAEIFERYFALNEYVKAIVLASREANIVLHSLYRDINITDTNTLAFLATITEHSDKATRVLELGEFKETIIEADLYYIMLSRLKYEIVLAAVFERDIPLGLMIRDFLSLKKEITELLP